MFYVELVWKGFSGEDILFWNCWFVGWFGRVIGGEVGSWFVKVVIWVGLNILVDFWIICFVFFIGNVWWGLYVSIKVRDWNIKMMMMKLNMSMSIVCFFYEVGKRMRFVCVCVCLEYFYFFFMYLWIFVVFMYLVFWVCS